jgi:hypothetical protein
MSPEGAEPAGQPIRAKKCPPKVRSPPVSRSCSRQRSDSVALRGVSHPTSPTCHTGRVRRALRRCGTGRGSIGEASLE